MMDNVYKYLRDPGWWFSAFFVAILASVIAGFAKEYLEKRFGVFLAWSRARRNELQNERARVIAAWSASETLVTLALLQMLYAWIAFIGLGAVVTVYISYLRLKYGFTGIEGATGLPLRTSLTLMLGVLGLVAIAVKTTVMVSRAHDVLKTFRGKRELPSFIGRDEDRYW